MRIVISGTTGVGKSTTVSKLSSLLEELNKDVVISSELVVESPFFDLYFENLAEWGFLSQLDFLLERFREFVRNEKKNSLKNNTNQDEKIFIYDRHFLEDKIFSRLQMIKDTTPKMLSNTYKNVYNQLLEKLLQEFEKIDLFIMLKADFSEIENRMNKRGRKEEEKFDRDYWLDLYKGYYKDKENRKILKQHSKQFVEINTTNLDPDQVAKKIIKYIEK